MHSLVVYGTRGVPGYSLGRQHVTIDGVTVPCGREFTAASPFDPQRAHRAHALVRVRAVSCNYRDRAIITSSANIPTARFASFGSEFVAEVVAVGADVTSLRAGDRVVPDCHYEGRPQHSTGVPAGVPTNRAARRMHVLHSTQLQRIPEALGDEVGAAFALNAQTAYSMVRRAQVRSGATVLVTSASSNLSLAVLGALRSHDVRVFVTTTSAESAQRLRVAAGAIEDVVVVGRALDGFRGDAALGEMAEAAGGFDFVFDPFFDLHLERSVEVMRPFGTYVTCGLAGQTTGSAASAGIERPLAMAPVMLEVMRKNLTLIGNCIGVSADLTRALEDYCAGRVGVTVDSVFSGESVAPFLDRTYNDPDRFGKVVFRFAD